MSFLHIALHGKVRRWMSHDMYPDTVVVVVWLF